MMAAYSHSLELVSRSLQEIGSGDVAVRQSVVVFGGKVIGSYFVVLP